MVDISKDLEAATKNYSLLNNVMWFSTSKVGVQEISAHLGSQVEHDFITRELMKNKIPFLVRKSSVVCYDPMVCIQAKDFDKLHSLCPTIKDVLFQNSEAKSLERIQRIEAAGDFIATQKMKHPDKVTTDPSAYYTFPRSDTESYQAMKKHMAVLGVSYAEAGGGDRIHLICDGHENFDKLNHAVNQSVLRAMTRAEDAIYGVITSNLPPSIPINGKLLPVNETNIDVMKMHLKTLGITHGEISTGGADYLSITGENNVNKFIWAMNCATRRDIESGLAHRAEIAKTPPPQPSF